MGIDERLAEFRSPVTALTVLLAVAPGGAATAQTAPLGRPSADCRLGRVDGIAELRRAAPALRRDLRGQGRALDRVAAYRLEAPGLERQCGARVRTGLPVVATGGAFLTAELAQNARVARCVLPRRCRR